MNDENFKWLRDQLLKMDARQDEQNVTLVRLTDTVEYHVKRTDLLETETKARDEALAKQLKPVEAHVAFVQTAGKIALWTGGSVAALAGFLKTIGVL